MSLRQDALDYHKKGRRGKIEVVTTKPCRTNRDLSLAYSPGVAEPCKEILRDPDTVYHYTAKGNMVAVVTNGSAVLGLGDIGPLASKPVMEGKGTLFKRFADIDVFDLELNTHDPDEFVRTVQLLEPTFGGINLEDIKGPECFYIEEKLQGLLDIPVFHDDQHGTAIIAVAAMLNALALLDKRIEDIRMVVNGAGAAGIATANLAIKLGVRPEHTTMCDSRGVIYRGRTQGMNEYKERLAVETSARTLGEALIDADVFVGLSVKGALSPEMLAKMGPDPIVFAMANPDPEITPEEALAVREDVIIGTGRSDYNNQINNVLCFPFIFRGALDTHARAINDEMRLAAVHALAELARETVPDMVRRAYANKSITFGRDYLIPKPFDPRVLLRVAPAVAQAAMDSGVARTPIDDMAHYCERLEAMQGHAKEIMRILLNKARANPRRVVFPEGDDPRVLRAAEIIVDEGTAIPILLGNHKIIKQQIAQLKLDLNGVEIIDPSSDSNLEKYIDALFELRQRRGVTRAEADRLLRNQRNYFGAMMVRQGDADAMLSGINHHYSETLRSALEVIGKRDGISRVHGAYMVVNKNNLALFADTTVVIEPNAEELAECAILTAARARYFDLEPKVAMLSFSNFGSVEHPKSLLVKEATQIAKKLDPNLIIDGELQANVALNPEIMEQQYPFSKLHGDANVFIFPDMQSGNIAYKLLNKLGGSETIGPILMGMRHPVHVLQRGDDVGHIVNMAAVAVVDAQEWS